MLIELYGKNFGSFRDEFRLSMLATDIEPGSDRGVVEVMIEDDDVPLRLLRCAAIYGPNASGKSTVLKAAQALKWMIEMPGFGRPGNIGRLYYLPFALDESRSKPVTLGIKAAVNSRVYEYSITFNETSVLREHLTVATGTFDQELIVSEGGQRDGHWLKDERFKAVTASPRSDVLLLTLADALATHLAKDLVPSLIRLLDVSPGPERSSVDFDAEQSASLAVENENFQDFVRQFLGAADLGINDFQLKPRSRSVRRGTKTGEVETVEKVFHQFELFHRAKQGPVALPFQFESLGTRRFVAKAPTLYRLTHARVPHAVFEDELDNSTHPETLAAWIRHFNSEVPIDKVRGQLIFTTHETSLMDGGEGSCAPLRRDQVYFTEKDADGASTLYSLADFKERQNVNLRKRYLEGRFGALPQTGLFPE